MNVNKMPSAEADAVMSGIYLDTKNFMVKTSMHTFEACSFLRKMGANTINVKKLFQTDMNTYMSRAEMVKSAQIRCV